jgi:hypothetical protein
MDDAPAGWKLVPIEPTMGMLTALLSELCDYPTKEYAIDAWKAAIAAAPQPQEQT